MILFQMTPFLSAIKRNFTFYHTIIRKTKKDEEGEIFYEKKMEQNC